MLISVSNVCVSPSCFCVVFFTIAMYLNSHFFNQFLSFRLWLVLVSIASCNFVAIVFLSVFLYWHSHSCNNQKSKFVKTLFVNLTTVAVFYCRYVIDKDVVESFYKESLFLVEYSLPVSLCLSVSLSLSLSLFLSLSLSLYIYIYKYIYIYMYIIYIYIYIHLTVTMTLFKTKIEKLNLIWDKQINFN